MSSIPLTRETTVALVLGESVESTPFTAKIELIRVNKIGTCGGNVVDEGNLDSSINARRHMSADGSKVIYDLTSGIDFSRGKGVVDTIAMLMWNNDLKAFWNEQGDVLSFNPRYDVEIRLPQLDEKKMQGVRQEIERDLEKSDMLNSFNDHLNRVSQQNVSFGEVMLLGPIWAFALAHHKSKVQKMDELAMLYSEMSSHISIVD